MKQIISNFKAIFFSMMILFSGFIFLIMKDVESVGEPEIIIVLSGSSVTVGNPAEGEEVYLYGEITVSNDDYDTRDVDVNLIIDYDDDEAIYTEITPDSFAFPGGSGNASFMLTFHSVIRKLPGNYMMNLIYEWSYSPLGSSGSNYGPTVSVQVEEYESAWVGFSSLNPKIETVSGIIEEYVWIYNEGNVDHHLHVEFEDYDEDVLFINPDNLDASLEPYDVAEGIIQFEAIEKDEYMLEPFSIVLYDHDTMEELDRIDLEIEYTPGIGPEDPPEANIEIGVDEAYYILWRDSDSFGIEIAVEGTTSGCEEVHIYMGLPGYEDTFTHENALALEEMDFEIEIAVPDSDLIFNTKVLFSDTSRNGDWSVFEFIQQVTYTGPEEDIAMAHAVMMGIVGDDISILVKAFPESGDDDLFSEKIEYVRITEGDRRGIDDNPGEGSEEPAQTEEDNNSVIYVIVGIIVAIALVVMIIAFVVISRR